MGLFGYYAVLNVAVLALVWRMGWRALGLVSFIATFGVMGAWVASSYRPAEYATTQAFLLLFMLVLPPFGCQGAGVVLVQLEQGIGQVASAGLLAGVGVGLELMAARDAR